MGCCGNSRPRFTRRGGTNMLSIKTSGCGTALTFIVLVKNKNVVNAYVWPTNGANSCNYLTLVMVSSTLLLRICGSHTICMLFPKDIWIIQRGSRTLQDPTWLRPCGKLTIFLSPPPSPENVFQKETKKKASTLKYSLIVKGG